MNKDEILGIGSTVWKFEADRRVYHPRGSKLFASTVGPIFREKFIRYQIVDETSKSWLVGFVNGEPGDGHGEGKASTGSLSKMPKNLKIPNGRVRLKYYTTQQMEDAVYVEDNRHRIAEFISREADATMLRQVAAIIGYASVDERANQSDGA
jgi:hypothetical protein